MGAESTSIDVLAELRSRRREALDGLIPVLYGELREIARRALSGRRESSTLATTALVHEAYLRLVDQSRAQWNDRAHFLALAAVAMRHILLDRAKARTALKRGGPQRLVTLEEDVIAIEDQPDALLQIHEALERLAAVNARLARVVECRFFGSMSNEEIAAALGVTERTVDRDWVKARMLLRDDLIP
jgi:RNA polymerase sigma factor (TIGR02999 family)